MISYIRKLLGRSNNWYPLSRVPEGFLSPQKNPGAITCPEAALSLSPFYAALRMYQTTLGSLPLVTYRRSPDGGRERARTHPAFKLLHDRPNPAQSRAVFFEYVAKEIFLAGNSYVLIRWAGNGSPYAFYPVPAHAVTKVWIDDEWNKAYEVQMADGKEVFDDQDMIHLFAFSDDGLQGKPLIRYAAESLGLHRQVLESANSFFANAARPSIYVRYPGKLDPQAVKNLKEGFKEEYQGTTNTGKVPVVEQGGEIAKLNDTTAEDMQVVEALGASVGDIARWFGLSPLLLGDLSRGTYSNLAADNAAFYQRSVRPLLDRIELEFNAKLFGPDADTYCEFLLDGILRGDPQQQQQIFNGYIQSGVMTRAEVREFMNLKPIPGLDTPLFPLNQGPELATEPTPTQESDATTADAQTAV